MNHESRIKNQAQTKNAFKLFLDSCFLIPASKSRGYTLLFAVITAGLVLGIAVFIVNVSRKQFELSVAARNSIYAFYAADSGIECVVNGSNWTTAFASTSGMGSSPTSVLNCGTGTATFTQVNPISVSPSSIVVNDPTNPNNTVRQVEGYVSLAYPDGGVATKQCSHIIITTGVDSSTGLPKTVVDSRGYNSCTTAPSVGPDITNPSTVERALRLIQNGVW